MERISTTVVLTGIVAIMVVVGFIIAFNTFAVIVLLSLLHVLVYFLLGCVFFDWSSYLA